MTKSIKIEFLSVPVRLPNPLFNWINFKCFDLAWKAFTNWPQPNVQSHFSLLPSHVPDIPAKPEYSLFLQYNLLCLCLCFPLYLECSTLLPSLLVGGQPKVFSFMKSCLIPDPLIFCFATNRISFSSEDSIAYCLYFSHGTYTYISFLSDNEFLERRNYDLLKNPCLLHSI